METMNISEIILDYIEQNRISKSALARAMGEVPKNTHKKLQNPEMSFSYVLEISKALEHDFLNDLSELHFGKESPTEELKLEVTILKREKETLMDIIGKRLERPS